LLKQHDDMTRPIVMQRAGLTVRCAVSSDWWRPTRPGRAAPWPADPGQEMASSIRAW